MFRYDQNAEEYTGTLLKIASVSEESEMKQLDKVPIHNLCEERNVGVINYELHIRIREKENLESASKKMILNKSEDLLNEMNSQNLNMYQKPAYT